CNFLAGKTFLRVANGVLRRRICRNVPALTASGARGNKEFISKTNKTKPAPAQCCRNAKIMRHASVAARPDRGATTDNTSLACCKFHKRLSHETFSKNFLKRTRAKPESPQRKNAASYKLHGIVSHTSHQRNDSCL